MGQIEPKPEGVEIPADETWESLTSYQRWYYKNKEKALERNRERYDALKDWLDEQKESLSCAECGEDHPATLDFHHRDSEEKVDAVTNMVRDGYSREKIREEMDKCDVLCANCHRKKHSERFI